MKGRRTFGKSTAKKVDEAWARIRKLQEKYGFPVKNQYDYAVLVKDWEMKETDASAVVHGAELIVRELGKLPWPIPVEAPRERRR